MNQLNPNYETLDEHGTTQDLSKNNKIVIKVMWLFDEVIIFQNGHWSEVFLWINQIPHIYWNKLIIPVSIGNMLLEKPINVSSKYSGLKSD